MSGSCHGSLHFSVYHHESSTNERMENLFSRLYEMQFSIVHLAWHSERRKKMSQAMECRVLIDNIHRDQRAINHGWRRANNTKIPSSQVFRVNHRPSTLFMFLFSIVSFDYKQGSAHTQFTNWIIKFHIHFFFRGSQRRQRSEMGMKTRSSPECRGEIFLFWFFSSALYGERWWCCVEYSCWMRWENISGFIIFVLLVFNSVLVWYLLSSLQKDDVLLIHITNK